MAKCETNVIQLNQACDVPNDIYVSDVSYNGNNGLLRVTLTDGTEYDVTISAVNITLDPDATNQLESGVDGLYVGGQLFVLNGQQIDYDDAIILTSSDSSVVISENTVGNATTIDLTVDDTGLGHNPLSVTPNVAYSFNPSTQQLNIPIPTIQKPSANSFYFAANDGSGTAFTITTHPSLNVSNGGPYAFNQSNQTLVLPIATLIDNGDGTYDYNPGDGSGIITIEAAGSYDNSGSSLLATTTQDAIDELANTDIPFALESGTQGDNTSGLNLTDDIYRTGSIGFGLNNTDTIQGILHARGDIYFENSGVYFLFGTGQSFKQIVEELSDSNQYRIETSTRTTLVVDSLGNISTDSIPTESMGAANTIILTDNNNSSAPNVPLSVNHVVNFGVLL